MTLDRTSAIAQRIVRQILKDRRSLALIIVAPLVVMSLVGFSFADQKPILNRVAPALLGVFALFFTFMLTGVSFLRERSQGTLERLLTTPVGRADILVGYMLGFLLFAAIQSLILVGFTVLVLQIDYKGNLGQIVAVLILLTIVAVSLGIFVSTFARNEFQVVQFIPLILAPQIFLSVVIIPVDEMPLVLEGIARVLPLTYAVDGLQGIMLMGRSLVDVWVDLAVLAAFGAALLAAAAATVKRS